MLYSEQSNNWAKTGWLIHEINVVKMFGVERLRARKNGAVNERWFLA